MDVSSVRVTSLTLRWGMECRPVHSSIPSGTLMYKNWSTRISHHAGGQGTASLTTITDVVEQTEGDKYVTNSLILLFIHTYMKRLGDSFEHGSIKKPWFGPANPRSEFPVSSAHESIKREHLSISQDLQDRWVTNLNEDRKRFFLIA
jgi:hypothetical protein